MMLSKLETVPYEDLVKAGNEAILKLFGPRKPGSKTMFGFAPSADGQVLLQQPFSPGFAEISKDVPLLIGTTLNELIKTAYDEKDLSMEQARSRLTKIYGEDTNQFIRLYEKTYPDFTPQDLLSVDTVFRPGTIMAADARTKQESAPVYTYFLAWKSPEDGATKGSFHGLDIPLAFNNIDLKPEWTGTTKEAYDLADKMSSAWLNFAKTGNPNVEGKLPDWEPYSIDNGETMIFNEKCRIVNNHDRELMSFIISK
ncbi:carboxylesterase family protein [Antarcticibacterium sp. 1MA-6-2]|uniref:carboxylesterase family protein n=1 Tax=Antarcticibacterium sp. 1MA-6-2 TaxID=2908210 RepID=UPI002107B5B4|nr:carboxylesterase family protein [Antarcticibacterium sp. 1MA-6-2]